MSVILAQKMMLCNSNLLQVLVEKLKWLTSMMFLELLALCQVMPGPTSTQMSFAIGVTQQGVTGGLLSGKYMDLVLPASLFSSSIKRRN